VSWKVKGSLFIDYVRMIRGRKDVDWSRHLEPAHLVYLSERIELERWYPMAAFERMGNAILVEIAQGELSAVRLWGRLSANALAELHPSLTADDDPREALMRFKVLRGTFFDFPALDLPMVSDTHARLIVGYGMGPTAEEAATYQTLGFCEGLLSLAGATEVQGEVVSRSWEGDEATVIELHWRPAGA